MTNKLLTEHDYTKLEFGELQEHIEAATQGCDWIKSDYNESVITSFMDVPGWINDAKWIFKEVIESCQDGDKVVEIGTYFGQSACYMGELIRDSGKDIKFDTFDTFEQLDPSIRAGKQPRQFVEYRLHKSRRTAPMSELVKGHFHACGVQDYVNQIVCDALYAHHLYEDNSLMMFYNDGVNQKEKLYQLITNFWPKIKRGGILAGDDINFDDVKSAVEKFCKEEKIEYEQTPVSWLIRKK